SPNVELQGAGTDNIYNQAEIGEDGSVTAKVTLNPGTLVGDLLVVKDGAGTVLFSGAVTEAMLKDGLDVEVPITDGLTDVKVTAQVTDQAGNLSPEAQDTAGLDNIAPPSPNVELQGAGADNIYNQAEIGEDGSVTAKVTLNPGTLVGDKLVVTDGAGNELFSGLVTEAMLKDGLEVEVPITAGLTDVKVTAQVTDQAGNLSPEAQDTAGLDNIAPPSPNVELQGAGTDNIYNQAEIGEDGSVTAKVTLNPGTLVGDLLVVKDGAGTVLFSGAVTEAMLKDGLDVEVPITAGLTDVKVTAQVTDQAGNLSPEAQDTAGLDNIAPPSPNVELQGAGADNIYNQAEIGEDGSVTAKVTLNPGTLVGDKLVVKNEAGDVLFSGLVTEAMLKDGLDVEVPITGGLTDVKVTAQVTDQAGNLSPEAQDTAGLDNIAPPSPNVELQGAGADNIYNQAEIGEDGSVTAKVTLNPGTLVGDKLVVKDGAGTVLFSGLVTEAMLKDGLDVEVQITAGLTDVKVTAQVTDQAGNLSPEAQDTAGLDTTAPSAPTVKIVDDLNDDLLLSKAEI
ncbi:MAG: hypothetical protein ACRC9N_05510, partial [Aeromonas sp.]